MVDVLPWSEAAARERLTGLTTRLPMSVPSSAEFSPGDSNDVWLLDDAVLRVAWRGDVERLIREAQVGAALPAEVRYPAVIGAGRHGELAWSITERLPGRPLATAWPVMAPHALRSTMRDLAGALRALHDWQPPDDVARVLDAHRLVGSRTEDITGADLVPLPVARVLRLLQPLRRGPFVDRAVVDVLEQRIRALAHVDPLGSGRDSVVVHGDAWPGNVLVLDGRVVALLDLEWVRFGPADLELAAWTRYVEELPLEFAERHPPPFLEWLQQDYPDLFASADLESRLWLYQIAYAIRHSLVWPAWAPESNLDPVHPLHRLRRLQHGPLLR